MSKRHITPKTLMAKASAACSDARILLEQGSTDGAANRAYYAMFDAARAALLLSGASVDLEQIRTHKGLIGAFGNYLVKNGSVSKDLGGLLTEAFGTRLMADYGGNFVELDDARNKVEQAEHFVSTMREKFMPENGDDDDS
jgi:uncharacterized protein (UPF0332 family)